TPPHLNLPAWEATRESNAMTEQRTILMVDDDRELRQGLQAVLNRHGYRTLEADDGHAATRLIDEHPPDLVIMDMMVPRGGGLAVLGRCRGKPDAPQFIMITATEGLQHQNEAEQLGVVDYIRKPFSVDRLLEGVNKVVRASAASAPTSPAAVE